MSSSAFRLDVAECRRLLGERVAEAAPGRIQLLTGPRQVGKTTLLLELAEQHGNGARYVAADGPEAMLPGFWERLWADAEARASAGQRMLVLLDEIQHLTDWSGRLKAEWDRLRRRRMPIHIIATGSSALHLGAGSRESLAGRFERIVLAHWPASAVASAFGLAVEEAARLVVRMGSYPGAIPLRDDLSRWLAYVRDAIVEPALERDILTLATVRRPALLRQVFALCATSPGQIVSLQKLQGQLQDRGALDTIAHYLAILEDAFLVAPLEKYSSRPARSRSAPPKLVTLSNALLAATDSRGIPNGATDPARFGAWVENACLAHAWNAGQHVRYWREEPLEVDAVIDGSWGQWAIEVKSGAWTAGDLAGLLEFTRRHPTYRPLVLCDAPAPVRRGRTGIPAQAWTDFLLRGPAAASGVV
jgi:predicted AAA+ superfamily ATPase